MGTKFCPFRVKGFPGEVPECREKDCALWVDGLGCAFLVIALEAINIRFIQAAS